MAGLTYGFGEEGANSNNAVGQKQQEDTGILQILFKGNQLVPDKFPKKTIPANEEDLFAGHMTEARRLAAHVCMVRSRPSSSWLGTKGTTKKKLRMPGKKLEVVAR